MNQYDAAAIENTWYQQWEQHQLFHPAGQGTPYTIMLPPPNVTGTLHMGHGFQHTLMDVLIRYHRMQGHRTLWQTGTDHAGIATQMVVERQLQAQGVNRHDLGRDDFITRVWDWKQQSGDQISEQMKRLGDSVDWSHACFTMDPQASQAVRHAFVTLYQQGLIHRGEKLVNWDPHFKTAISDLEVTASEEAGQLWHIRYLIVGSNQSITVATTRPETLFADSAIAIHPDDQRYQHLIGQQAAIPLTGRPIPIITDQVVDPTFGSGCVKITPAHDFNDYEVGQRHQLPLINILQPDATLAPHEMVPEHHHGLSCEAARTQVVAELQQQGFLVKTEPHTLQVPRGDRSGAVIQPYLTQQWFMSMKSLAQPAIEAMQQGRVRMVPPHWQKTYFQWLEEIQDWCISRQLWWGHRIPAWYDQQGHVYVGTDERAVRQQHQLPDDIILTQDEDVLDTWFSSALWPLITLGWPKATERFQTFYPTQVLVTGFDIIFFWVARMIMMGLHFTGEVPFQDIYITGLIRDTHGQKMSKSKGNTLDPLDLIDGITLPDLIEKRTTGLMQPQQKADITERTQLEFPDGIQAHGCDALRMTFCALASTGRDIRFDLARLDGYRNFCNKLWHASRLVMMHIEPNTSIDLPDELPIYERYILSQLQKTIQSCHQHIKTYRFDQLANALHQFVWDVWCSWYLEMAKVTLHRDDVTASEHAATRTVLRHTLEQVLKLLHPIIPFITEEIWSQLNQHLQQDRGFMIQTTYPQADAALMDDAVEQTTGWLQDLVVALRQIRSHHHVPPQATVALYLEIPQARDREQLQQHQVMLMALAKISEIHIDRVPDIECGRSQVKDITVHMVLPEVDREAEIERLEQKLVKLRKKRDKLQYKLFETKFSEKAPPEIVQAEQDALTALIHEIRGLNQQVHRHRS